MGERERERERERGERERGEREGRERGLNNHFVEKFTLSFKIFKPYIVFFLAQSNTQSFKI